MPDDAELDAIEQLVEEKRAEGRGRAAFPDDLPDRSPLLTGQPAAPDTEAVDVPFVDLSEVAKAWGWNAREATAYAVGWRQAITYGADGTGEPVPLVRIRCHRDQAGALLAALIEAGGNVTGYGSYRDHRTYNVTIR